MPTPARAPLSAETASPNSAIIAFSSRLGSPAAAAPSALHGGGARDLPVERHSIAAEAEPRPRPHDVGQVDQVLEQRHFLLTTVITLRAAPAVVRVSAEHGQGLWLLPT